MTAAGIPSVSVKAFLVERPHVLRRGEPQKASLEPEDPLGCRLRLRLPKGEEWLVERESLEFVLQSVREHLEHVRAKA